MACHGVKTPVESRRPSSPGRSCDSCKSTSKCCPVPTLRQVLKAGNHTRGSDIYLSRGDSLVSQDLSLIGEKSVTIDSRGDLTANVAGNLSVQVTGGSATTVAEYVLNVVGAALTNVQGTSVVEVGGDYDTNVTGAYRLNVGGESTTNVVSDAFSNVGGFRSDAIVSDYNLRVGGNFNLEVGPLTPTPGAPSSALRVTPTELTFSTPNVANPEQPSSTFTIVPSGVTVNAPVTTINGDLVVTGTITPSLSAIPFFRVTYTQTPLVSGGPSEAGGWFNRFFTSLIDDGLELGLDETVITLSTPGTYSVNGFMTFFSVSSSVISVARFAQVNPPSGVLPIAIIGSNVYGTGVSVLSDVFTIDAPTSFAFQYRTTASQVDGLGQASGISENNYLSLLVTKLR